MKTKMMTFLGLALLLSCSACNSQNSDICLDSDQDGAYILATHLELSDTQAEAAFDCVKPLDAELDCDDTNADINPSVLEESETDTDLNCNGLIQGSEGAALAVVEVCTATTALDTDADGITNECDTDDDDDGVLDSADNCIYTPNPGQENADSNALGDVCETALDADTDGVGDDYDNCAYVSNVGQDDLDDDGFGDECDADPEDPDVGQVQMDALVYELNSSRMFLIAETQITSSVMSRYTPPLASAITFGTSSYAQTTSSYNFGPAFTSPTFVVNAPTSYTYPNTKAFTAPTISFGVGVKSYFPNDDAEPNPSERFHLLSGAGLHLNTP